MGEYSDLAEKLLDTPYVLVDILPRRVPGESPGRYFEIERYYLKEPQRSRLREKFADIMLKLNCYYGLLFLRDGEEQQVSCEKAAELVTSGNEQLCVLTEPGHALITVAADDTYMTVYHADEDLLLLLKELAAANGMFVWRPEEEE